MIEVRCPVCSKTVHVADSYAGKQGKCLGCETVLTVPAAGTEPAGQPSVQQPILMTNSVASGETQAAPQTPPTPQTPPAYQPERLTVNPTRVNPPVRHWRWKTTTITIITLGVLLVAAVAGLIVLLSSNDEVTDISTASSSQVVETVVSSTSDSGTKPQADEPVELTAEEVVQAFQSAGLPLDNVVVYTAASDTNSLLGRPGQYTGKANWADTRIEQLDPTERIGGTVEVFATQEALTARREYIESVTADIPMLQQFFFQSGNALVRLDYDLTPEQAAQYETVLLSLAE